MGVSNGGRALLLVLAAVVIAGGCDGATQSAPPVSIGSTDSPDAGAQDTPGADVPTPTTGTESFRPVGRTQTATVVRIVDGDTIIVRLGGRNLRLRYIGMNTPETVKPDTAVQRMGPEAAAENRALVAGRTVILEKDVSETDRYGRLLRYVWLHQGASWTMVGLELVRRGFAQVETDPPDVRYADRFLAAQRVARTAGRGLWGPHPDASP
jgi:micrococcal nuclease